MVSKRRPVRALTLVVVVALLAGCAQLSESEALAKLGRSEGIAADVVRSAMGDGAVADWSRDAVGYGPSGPCSRVLSSIDLGDGYDSAVLDDVAAATQSLGGRAGAVHDDSGAVTQNGTTTPHTPMMAVTIDMGPQYYPITFRWVSDPPAEPPGSIHGGLTARIDTDCYKPDK